MVYLWHFITRAVLKLSRMESPSNSEQESPSTVLVIVRGLTDLVHTVLQYIQCTFDSNYCGVSSFIGGNSFRRAFHTILRVWRGLFAVGVKGFKAEMLFHGSAILPSNSTVWRISKRCRNVFNSLCVLDWTAEWYRGLLQGPPSLTPGNDGDDGNDSVWNSGGGSGPSLLRHGLFIFATVLTALLSEELTSGHRLSLRRSEMIKTLWKMWRRLVQVSFNEGNEGIACEAPSVRLVEDDAGSSKEVPLDQLIHSMVAVGVTLDPSLSTFFWGSGSGGAHQGNLDNSSSAPADVSRESRCPSVNEFIADLMVVQRDLGLFPQISAEAVLEAINAVNNEKLKETAANDPGEPFDEQNASLSPVQSTGNALNDDKCVLVQRKRPRDEEEEEEPSPVKEVARDSLVDGSVKPSLPPLSGSTLPDQVTRALQRITNILTSLEATGEDSSEDKEQLLLEAVEQSHNLSRGLLHLITSARLKSS